MLFPRWICFLVGQYFVLLMDSRVTAMSLPRVVYSHAGICPNDMNPNLWVDAMSTCMRECESDQVSLLAARLIYHIFFCLQIGEQV